MMADNPDSNSQAPFPPQVKGPPQAEGPPQAKGTHVLLDIYGVKRLDDPAYLEDVMRQSASAAGAHIIGAHFHHFGLEQGVTGLLLLAESHISIHTWPERDYAAIDLFLCGNIAGVDAAIDILTTSLQPKTTKEQRILRGAPLPD
ncbi:adenosylmethionine decarboxylase [Parasphingorhabdus sp. DH2-15]|uniref:adenosylmethionine decarboxylase n=1 Tax=Parasphingorhabdus sp. DH2-15 TaxID=3444112 RepID=UPI003F684226